MPNQSSRFRTGNGDANPAVSPRHRSLDLDYLIFLPFAEFARTVADLLVRMGYEDVRLVGRAAGGGRNGTGGYDLRCTVASTSGESPRTVLVLLKQFGRNAWVFQRMVDELRGVAVREGADEAILITTGKLSPIIAQCEGVEGADPASRTLPPVERIGGDRLRWLLAAYGVPAKIPRASSPASAVSPANPASLVPTAAPVSGEAPARSKQRTSPDSGGEIKVGKAAIASTPPTGRRETSLLLSGEPMPKPCGIVLEVRVTITR